MVLSQSFLFKRCFSTSRPRFDLATCQLLGRFGNTPQVFQTKDGRPAVRYLFAVNRGQQPGGNNNNTDSSQSTSWFNVVSFDERSIERLTNEDLKGAKALINANLDVKKHKDESTGVYSDIVNIRQTGMHILERSKKSGSGEGQQQQQSDAEAQRLAGEDSFSV